MQRVADRIRTWAVVLLCGASLIAWTAPSHAEGTDQPKSVSAQSWKFTQIPDMPACATAAIVRGDPRNGPAWVLLKLDSGCRVPWHWHTANETLMVIRGQGTLAMKDGPPLAFAPGAYTLLPARHVHQASCTRTCLLFNTADAAFDIHYVDASGKEIAPADAFKRPARAKPGKR
jgi:quercetin dioxygenase-like cupin family protein